MRGKYRCSAWGPWCDPRVQARAAYPAGAQPFMCECPLFLPHSGCQQALLQQGRVPKPSRVHFANKHLHHNNDTPNTIRVPSAVFVCIYRICQKSVFSQGSVRVQRVTWGGRSLVSIKRSLRAVPDASSTASLSN